MSNVNNKIDTSITKLTDVSTSIKSMLAVHEDLGKQEDVDNNIQPIREVEESKVKISLKIYIVD